MTSSPVLVHLDPESPLVLETDVLDFTYGATLWVCRTNGSLQPCAYMSKKMDDTQRNYPMYDKELLAIVEAFKEWRTYLLPNHHPISVRTDHWSLEYFWKPQNLNQRQVCSHAYLQAFQFTVEYKPRATNSMEALSRCEDLGGGKIEINKDITFFAPS